MTLLSTIIGYVRAAVQDYDSDCYLYSDAALKQQISFTALGKSFDVSGAVVTTYDQDVNGDFLKDLTPQEKIVLGIETAIRLLVSVPSEFSYRSPVFAVTRKRGATGDQSLVNALEDMLAVAQGGKFAIATDTDFNMIIQGFNRFFNDYNRADTAWTGSPQ